MKDKDPPTSLNNLDERLKSAQARRPGAKPPDDKALRGSGLSLAFRIGAELVAALIVGVGIGLLLDHWLGTKPWMLLLFFVLGSAAGIINIFRVMEGYGYAAGYKERDEAKGPTGRDDDNKD